MRPKITIIGAGQVGTAVAQRLAERDRVDVVLVDVVEGLPQGRALDLLESAPIVGFDSRLSGTNGYDETEGSTIVVVTGGAARRPGMSRDDLVTTNAAVVAGAAREAVQRSPECVLLMVTNPLDAMAQVAHTVTGLPRRRVVGMAGILDAARFRTFVATELSTSPSAVDAMVLGGHGDSMVPLTRLATAWNVPITELIPTDRLASIVQRVRDGGAEIVELVRTGSAFYAPSAAVAQMVDALLTESDEVMPCSVRLEGEYGIDGVFTGVPCRLGAGGVEEIVELPLREDEAAALHRSAESVADLTRLIATRVPGLEAVAAGA